MGWIFLALLIIFTHGSPDIMDGIILKLIGKKNYVEWNMIEKEKLSKELKESIESVGVE